MRRFILGATASLAVLAAPIAARAQQQREVSGRVTQAATGSPLPDISVGVVGQLVGARTDQNGEYHLRVRGGDITLMVRALGYKRQTHRVGPNETTVNFALDKDVLQLEGVTVTGAATTIERRNATSAVSEVNSEQLARVPAQTLESALQGKVLGASINLNNGAPGGGGQIQIRGASSLLGRIDPLIVVDGVIISNSVRSNGQAVITGSLNAGEENGTNRLADINPADIENVEVLKGSVASAIYGSQATNGVVIITTKRGRSGTPRFNFTQRVGTYQLIRNNGMRHFPGLKSVLTDPYVSCSDSVASLANPDPSACGNPDGAAAALKACSATTCPYYDYIGELYGRTAPSLESTATLSGGVDATKYFLSATDRQEQGTAPNTGARHQSMRVNIDQSVGSKLTVSAGGSLIRSFNQRGISNNDNTNSSPIYAFFTTPPVIDLRQENAQTGDYVRNPFAGGGPLYGSNPFETFDRMRNNEDVYRMLANYSLNYALFSNDSHNIRVSLTGGFDRASDENYMFAPPSLQFEQPGTNNGTYPGASIQGNGDNLLTNNALNGIWTFDPSNKLFTATTSAGLQDEVRQGNDYMIIAQGLLPTMPDPSNAQFTATRDSRSEVHNQAYYVQEEFLTLGERLLLSAALRGERSSVNGDPNKLYTFPRFGASYRFTNPLPGVSSLKLRATRGQAGNQPNYGDRFITLSPAGLIGGMSGLVANSVLGNPNIKPERLDESEYGFDASFLNDRAHLEATYFNRDITDLLVRPQIALSTGVSRLTINGGVMRTRGTEIGLTLVPVETHSTTWTSHTTFQDNKATIVSFPAGVNPFRLGAEGGFGYAYGTIVYTPGHTATTIWGNKPGAKKVPVGDANPLFTMGFSNDVTFGSFTFSSLVDWRKGGDLSNLTLASFDDGRTSWDYDKKSPDPKMTLGEYRQAQWNGGNNTSVYINDGSFVKLRELTLAYDVPRARTARLQALGLQNLRLSLSGRNLFIISPYNGFDPEVNNGGNTVARFVDLAPYPPSRSFYLTVDMGF